MSGVPAADNLRQMAANNADLWRTNTTDGVLDAADMLEAIDALHGGPNVYDWNGISGPQHLELCIGCGNRWPCPTHLILHPTEQA